MKRYVVKLSGHLINNIELMEQLLTRMHNIHRNNIAYFALLPGGSVFADTVLEYQRRVHYSDDEAHWMAIKAMEVYGAYVSSHFGDIVFEVDNIDGLNMRGDKMPLIMPYKVLKKFDELPHSWSVSSDSIAVYITHLLRFDETILTKPVDGLIKDNRVIAEVNSSEALAVRDNVFDEYMLSLVRQYGIPVIIFNFNKPWIIDDVVNNVKGSYTRIIP